MAKKKTEDSVDISLLERLSSALASPYSETRTSLTVDNVWGKMRVRELKFDAHKITEPLDEWQEKYPNIALSTYHSDQYSSEGRAFVRSCLQEQYMPEVASTLLDAGVESADLVQIYLRNAIIRDDATLCKRVLDILPRYNLDVNGFEIEQLSVLSHAAFIAAPECIRPILEHGGKAKREITEGQEKAYPLVALQNSYQIDTAKLVQSFEALMAAGIKIQHHAVHCNHLNVEVKSVFRRGTSAGRLLMGHFVRNGLNLNINAGSDDFTVYPNHYFIVKKEGHEVFATLQYLSEDARTDIDLGVKIPEERLHIFLRDARQYPEDFLPINQPSSRMYSEELSVVPDYAKIDCFIANGLPAERLACRCFSFGLLDQTMFEAILKTANKERARNGDPELRAEQFFSRLPPFVQNDEAWIAIRQAISHAQAASSDGIGQLREKVLSRNQNKSVVE